MMLMISLRMRTLGVERAGGDINWLETHLDTLQKTATRMIMGEVEYLATGRQPPWTLASRCTVHR